MPGEAQIGRTFLGEDPTSYTFAEQSRVRFD